MGAPDRDANECDRVGCWFVRSSRHALLFLPTSCAQEWNRADGFQQVGEKLFVSWFPSLHFYIYQLFLFFFCFLLLVRRRLVQVARWSTHLPSSRIFLGFFFFFFFCLSSFENDVSSLKASRRARGEGLPPGGGDFFFGWAGGGGRFYSSEEPTCLGWFSVECSW